MTPKGIVREGLLVIGNLNVDRIYSVPRIPTEGRSVPILREMVRFGGCGGNIAIAASRMGIGTRLSSVVGGDFDPLYMARVRQCGIDTSDVIGLPDQRSPYCIILSAPEGSQVYAFDMGAMTKQSDMPVPDPGDSVYCHAATSDPAYCAKVFERMKRSGVSTGLDPGQEIFFRWTRGEMEPVLKRTDRFFGNLQEWTKLGEMMGWERVGSDVPLFREAFGFIEEAVVTMGARGAALVRPRETFIDPAFDAGPMVDATGAGDGFRGAYYAALGRDLGPRKALHYGNVMGGFITCREGPQEYSIDWDGLVALDKH